MEMESGRFKTKEEARTYVEKIYFPKRKKKLSILNNPITKKKKEGEFIISDDESNDIGNTRRRKRIYETSQVSDINFKEEDEATVFKRRKLIY
mgnify:CR=1 FL=1